MWQTTLSGIIFGAIYVALSIITNSDPFTTAIGWLLPIILAGFVGFIIGFLRSRRRDPE